MGGPYDSVETGIATHIAQWRNLWVRWRRDTVSEGVDDVRCCDLQWREHPLVGTEAHSRTAPLSNSVSMPSRDC